jgi:gluconolactonase
MAYSQQIKPGGRLIVNNPLFHGTVFTGEATSNCAFNADFSELFLTADDYLLRVKLK